MTPFQLNIIMKTPASIQPDCTLDALLAAAIYRMTGSPDQAHSQIPLQCTDGLWHGSRVYLGNGERSQSTFVERIAMRDLTAGGYKNPRKRSKKKGTVPDIEVATVSTVYAPRLNTLNTHVGELKFFGCGDIDQVQDLLMTLPGLGRASRQGFGRIAAIDIEEIDQDLSIVDTEGVPARRVPVAIWQAMGLKLDGRAVEEVTWKPAYWNRENMGLCVVA